MSKPPTLRICAAAALLLLTAAPAQAAPAPAAASFPATQPIPEQEAAPQPVDLAFLEAVNALSMEINRAFPWRANLVRTLDDFSSFRYSPESSAKFVKVFGTDQPLIVKRTASSKTRLSYAMTLQPLEYTMSHGSLFSWAPMTGTIHTDLGGKRYSFDGAWPSMKITSKEATVALADMSASGTMRRGIEGLWFGPMRFALKSMTVNEGAVFAMDDTSAALNVTERGKLVDMTYAIGARSIKVGATQAGAFDMAGRIVGLPARALAALLDAQARLDEIIDPVEQEKQTLNEIKRLGPTFAASGGALHIDRLQLTHKGHSASLKGRLVFRPMKDASGAAPADILKHLSGKFTLRVPVPLMTEMAREIARSQLEQQKPGAPVDQAALAEAANNVKDAMIGKAVGSGFAKLEKGELVSTIVFSNGKLTANGKTIDMPSPPGDGKDAPPEQAPPPRELALAERTVP